MKNMQLPPPPPSVSPLEKSAPGRNALNDIHSSYWCRTVGRNSGDTTKSYAHTGVLVNDDRPLSHPEEGWTLGTP